MKKGILWAVVCLVFGMGLYACGPDGATDTHAAVVLTANDTGTNLTLYKGQILKVSLWGNSSTGYLWEVVAGAGPILEQQGGPQFVPDSNAVGSGGMYTFTFKAIALGNATLQLIYHQPWQTAVPPLQTFETTITVVN